MPLEYCITYKAENTYEHWVDEAHWQFLIIPEENDTQEYISTEFSNSIHSLNEYSINGYGFETIKVRTTQRLKDASFEATFKLLKKEKNPFDFYPEENIDLAYAEIRQLDFRVDFGSFLKSTRFTLLPEKNQSIYIFDRSKSIFTNLQELNKWTYEHFFFKTNVTHVNTTLEEILSNKHGVCQDFTHLFCSLSRQNGVPARYVSGYLHQGNGYFGDSQMHAWAEAYVPNMGWIGFDPTNDILANQNHIKVSHGKDYSDCAPLKGVVQTIGTNETKHLVSVLTPQQQQQ